MIFEEDLRQQSFPLDWMLLETGNNSVVKYFNKSDLEKGLE